jgi:hypothetical protein
LHGNNNIKPATLIDRVTEFKCLRQNLDRWVIPSIKEEERAKSLAYISSLDDRLEKATSELKFLTEELNTAKAVHNASSFS